jgi:hypothetical protein
MEASPADLIAATSVVWSAEFTIFCIIFFEGYIGAPPTCTGFWAPAAAANTVKTISISHIFFIQQV